MEELCPRICSAATSHSPQDGAPSYVGHLLELDAGIQLAGPRWLLNMSTASDKCQDSLVNRNPDGIFSSTAAILVLFIFSLFWTLYKEGKNPSIYRELSAGRRRLSVPAARSSSVPG